MASFIGRSEPGVLKVEFRVNVWKSSKEATRKNALGPQGSLSYTVLYCAVLYATEVTFRAEYLSGSEPLTRLTT